jgi:hypothetical protein
MLFLICQLLASALGQIKISLSGANPNGFRRPTVRKVPRYSTFLPSVPGHERGYQIIVKTLRSPMRTCMSLVQRIVCIMFAAVAPNKRSKFAFNFVSFSRKVCKSRGALSLLLIPTPSSHVSIPNLLFRAAPLDRTHNPSLYPRLQLRPEHQPLALNKQMLDSRFRFHMNKLLSLQYQTASKYQTASHKLHFRGLFRLSISPKSL